LIDEKLNGEMQAVREIISIGLQKRAQAKIKVRQPLQTVNIQYQKLNEELEGIIKEELNVKEIKISEKLEAEVVLDMEITPELKLEGQAREAIRFIQEMRKEAGYEVDNRIKISYTPQSAIFEKFGALIAKETLADKLGNGKITRADLKKEFEIDGIKIVLYIKK
jgi:isoleucyl-tRNA synthetase